MKNSTNRISKNVKYYFLTGQCTSMIFTMLFVMTSLVKAQIAPVKEWDKRFGGSSSDHLRTVHQTSEGGYIMGGFSLSGISGDKTEANWDPVPFTFDYWIVKTDSIGVKEWDKRFGGTSDEEFCSMQQTIDGGYILGGSSSSGISGDKTQASQGGHDYWIVKTNANGIKEWDKRYGSTSGLERFKSLQQTSDGGYILGGYSLGGINGDKTQASQGGDDYWIIKIDANGLKQWDSRFGGSTLDRLSFLQQTAEGGYILGGVSLSGISGDKTQASQGGYDYWVVKCDANGVKQWDRTFGGNGDDQLISIQQTSDGGYLLGGYSLSGISGDKTQANWDPTQATYDYWIIKTDVNGVKQWDKTFGGTKNDIFYSLKQTADGDFILGGSSESPISGDKTQIPQGDYDYWMVKTDPNGLKLWDVRFGGNDYDALAFLQQTADEGYILGGESLSLVIGGDKTQATQGSYDYWVVKVSPDCNSSTYYSDSDGDGFGNLLVSTTGCIAPIGYVANSADCNDAENLTHPGAVESCNSVDDNCDGLIDESCYSITAGTISGSPFCPEEQLNVPFNSNGMFSAGNVYTAQLSDKKGNFASPTTIGTLTSSSNSGTIIATITSEPKNGTMYRIRVTSSLPSLTGTENDTKLQVAACDKVTGLFVSSIGPSSATINWTSVSCAAKYKVQYRKQGTTTWTKANSTTGSYSINGLLANTVYEWRIQTWCTASGSSKSGQTSIQSFSTAERLGANLASQEEMMMTLYPNPTSELTTIQFTLWESSHVSIRVLDLAGKEVTSLLNNVILQGDHFIDLNTTQFTKGVYIVQIMNDKGLENQKLIVQ